MNAELKPIWCEALRSGKYAQNQNSLEGKFADEVGLSEDELEKLVTMNDIESKSFSEIADYIEEAL